MTNPAQHTHSDQRNDTRREDFEKSLTTYGKAYGQGTNSRPAAAQAALEASVQGIAGPNDVKELWTLFQKSAAKAKSIEYKEEGSFTVQVSKFKQFLTMGQLPVDAVEVMGRATDMISELAMDETTRKALKGSAYDNMVKIAREQIKEGDNALTDDHIRSILMPDAPPKDEAKILKGVSKTLEKLLDGDKEGNKFYSPQAQTAFEHVQNRLAELGAIEQRSGTATASDEEKESESAITPPHVANRTEIAPMEFEPDVDKWVEHAQAADTVPLVTRADHPSPVEADDESEAEVERNKQRLVEWAAQHAPKHTQEQDDEELSSVA